MKLENGDELIMMGRKLIIETKKIHHFANRSIVLKVLDTEGVQISVMVSSCKYNVAHGIANFYLGKKS